MKIEILYPEICNLYGDRGNITYLKKCLPKAKFIETRLCEVPKFMSEKIDLIYMGSMTEKSQEKAINELLPYKKTIENLIENNTVFLLVGNSFEIFTKYIEDENGKKTNALNILDFHVKRFIPKRFNSLFLGNFNDKKIVGYSSRFSHTYGDNTNNYLFEVEKGLGINEESKYEGIRINNLFATYMLGPILPSNPFFTEYLLKLMGCKTTIAFKSTAIQAYNQKVSDYQKDIELN